MLKFYYSIRSPYARKVRILLSELDARHEPVEIVAGSFEEGSLFGEEYEKLVPSMRVPALQDGENLIFESNAIITYLYHVRDIRAVSEKNPPLATSVVRPDKPWLDTMILTTIDILLDSAINVFQVTRFGTSADSNPYLLREQKRCQSCLDWLEDKVLDSGEFVSGVFSVADVNLLCALQYFDQRQTVSWRGRPRLEALVSRFENRPSVAGNPLILS